MLEDEDKHKSIRSALKKLPKVKAHKDFEPRLYQRLRSIESERLSSPSFRKLESAGVSKGWFSKFFRPVLIPAVGLTVILFIAILAYIHHSSLDQTNQSPITQTITPEQKEKSVQPEITGNNPIAKSETSESNTKLSTRSENNNGYTEHERTYKESAPVPPPSMEMEKRESPKNPIDELSIPPSEKSEEKLPEEMEKKSDGVLKGDVNQAPENKLKEEQPERKNEIIQQDILPSVIEGKFMDKDSSKIDSTKLKHLIKGKHKKSSKQPEDSTKVNPENEGNDSTKNK